MKLITIYLTIVMTVFLSACEPEVGSDAWCTKMDETTKGDWTGNDAKEYASSCIFRTQE